MSRVVICRIEKNIIRTLSLQSKSNSKYSDPNNPEAEFYEVSGYNSPQTLGFKHQESDTGITVDSES